MKLTFSLLFLCVMQLSASVYSQNARLSLNLKNTTVKEVLQMIEDQSEYRFFYNEQFIDLNRKVSVKTDNSNVEAILNEVLDGANVSFKVMENNLIIITPADGVQAQMQKIVSGKVTDFSGAPLPGVSVVVKGTTTGTITDFDGNYTLANVPGDATVVFSFVGMRSQEISVTGKISINVKMEEENIGIEEVVAIGYGTQRKVNLTGSVSAVNFENEAYQSRSTSNVSSLLTGMTSGIRVQQANGLPSDNDNASINIRGIGSLNASSSPLVLVDGQVASFNSVSPNDVASVSILKDAASAAIYGSRASNGVILITTKSGKNTNGKVTFKYNNYVGKSTYTNKDDLVDQSADYMKLINMMNVNSGLAIKFPQEYIEEWIEGSKTDPIYYPNTNWWKAITKENTVMNHHFSAGGGNDRIGFYSAIEYFSDNGLVSNTGYKKVTFRNNLDYQVNNWLKLGNNISYTSSNIEPGTISAAFQWFKATTPAVVPKHSDGRYGSGQLLAGEGGDNNLLAEVESQRGETKTNQLQGKVYVILTPLKGLTVTGSYFRDLYLTEAWSGSVPVDRWNFQTNAIGINKTSGAVLGLGNSYSRSQREVIDVYADYNLSIGGHNIHALAGFNQEYYITKNFSATKVDLLSYDTPVLSAAATLQTASGDASDYSMRSFFGRINYDFKSKYLFETNLRYDGSSRFAPDKRWGLFPSVSAGWMISKESFWEPFSHVVNSFKLRVSWGELGNNGIGNYEWQNFYQAANYTLNNKAVQGLRFDAFGNPTITWETTEIINGGVDFRLFNALTFDINYYNKHTFNILANVPIPMVNGNITAPRINSAEVLNRGIETEVRYSKNFGKLSLNVAANFAYNKNKILKYKGDLIEPRSSTEAWTEGQPIGIYWLREVDHIVQDISEINAMVENGFTFHPQTPGVGDFLYKNNNNDKAINNDDRVLKGNPVPLFTYGGSLGLAYAGFDFNMYFDGVGKWDRYVPGTTYSLNHLSGYQWPKEYLDAWTPENPGSKIPKIYTNNEKNNQISDYFLHSAAYLKVRSVQLGYNLPDKLVRSVNFDKVRLFVNLENYFRFTKWPTMDPEVTFSYDQTYPLTKTASVGVSVSF